MECNKKCNREKKEFLPHHLLHRALQFPLHQALKNLPNAQFAKNLPPMNAQERKIEDAKIQVSINNQIEIEEETEVANFSPAEDDIN